MRNKLKLDTLIWLHERSNLVDELHWNTINYLTQHYKRILSGMTSSKNIVSKQHGVLNQSMKTVASIYKVCQFSQRLEYK